MIAKDNNFLERHSNSNYHTDKAETECDGETESCKKVCRSTKNKPRFYHPPTIPKKKKNEHSQRTITKIISHHLILIS